MGDLTLDNIKSLLDNQTKQITHDIKPDLEDINRRLYGQKQRIERLEDRCLFLERKVRKNNVVIFGLAVDNSELAVNTLKQINQLLDLIFSINDINNVYKIGKSDNSPIVVEFLSYHRKIEIFKNKEKLKLLKTKKVAISNDLCMQDRKDQKILRQRLKQAKQDNLQARIIGHKIEIEGKSYTARDLEETESECDTYQDESEDGKELAASETSNQPNDDAERKMKYLTPSPTTKTRTLRKKKKRN